ncbi:amino acid adenylation domain-containing protein [Streptomyces sp. NPDC006668]|uniref:amino acid adenylation domain-containing protein n=1 Tax=Streptomyces sp. NPDC006668 TaxID=3156903 RepID=UPI0033F944A7
MRCVLIGEQALLVECAATLLDGGHRVTALVSGNPDLRAWARERGVPEHDFGPHLTEVLGRTPFDHLFSITNLRILPPDLLALPTGMAVNFHDALLPRHAGMHATSWALLEGEREHGVTWHVMTEKADAGDVLAQRTVAVDAEETAYTLNVKCFQAGLESFAGLVDELAVGRVSRRPQDLRERTYHARDDAVPDGGVLLWSRSARRLHSLVRALDFGRHPNALASAKLFGPSGLALVGACEVSRAHSGRPPGTVLAVDDAGITVATADADLTVRRLSTVDGVALGGRDLAHRWHIRPGDRLPRPGHVLIGALIAQTTALRPHERHWARRLADLHPLDLAHRDPLPSTARGWHDLEVAVPAGLAAAAGGRPAEAVLAAVLSFLARADGGDIHDIGLRRRQPALRTGTEVFFAEEVPLRLPALVPGRGLSDLAARLSGELAERARRMTYPRDLPTRFRLPYDAMTGEGLPVVVDLGAEPPHAPRPGSTALVHVPPGGRRCRLLVAADLVGAPAAHRLREDLTAYLAALTATPGDVLALPLLPAAGRHTATEGYDTARPRPRDMCVTRLVAEQVQRRPEAIAVTDDAGAVSYGELGRRIDRLAAALCSAGVTRGSRVGVFLGRSVDLVVALLAVLRAGAAYVPLDPVYPAERIRFMIGDAGVAVVVSRPALAAGLEAGVQVVDVDECGRRATDRGSTAATFEPWQDPIVCGRAPEPRTPAPDVRGLPDHASADDPAYVIYTSGSTGRPKGVQVGHRALTNLLLAMASEPGCGQSDTLLAVTTVCFDIAGLELFLPLVTGATVDVVPEQVAVDGFALRQRLESTRPTLMQATPATWRMLITAGWKGDPRLRVLCGGEALTPDLAEALTRRAGEVWNMYGPTETTIWSAAGRVETGGRVTLGRPIANTRFHVLDPRGLPVPPYVPGELHIGGDGVADGYVGRPALTAERFPPDRFHGSGRIYRTGDIVRRLADGTLEYLHRTDHQVKVNGFRVELGEIEAALSGHPHVSQAVAVVRETVPGDRRLTAYVVPAEGEAPMAPELRRHLSRLLPSYMIPGSFVAVARMPLTQNGKVDRAALPEPRTAPTVKSAGPPPRTQVERIVAAAWRSVLRVGDIAVDDNFFDVGGTSLLLTEVVRQLREDLGIPLTSLDMFGHPTIGAMARHLTGRGPAGDTGDTALPGQRPDRAALHRRLRARRASAD